MQTIEAERTVTADTNDVLGTTALKTIPGPGALAIYLASTAADSEASVSVGGRTLKTKGLIGKVGTNAQIDVVSDAALVTTVRGGESPLVDVDVVTAGTIRVKAIWVGKVR